jgi:hypothetical protein
MFAPLKLTFSRTFVLLALVGLLTSVAVLQIGSAPAQAAPILPFKPDLVIDGPANGGTGFFVKNAGFAPTQSGYVVAVTDPNHITTLRKVTQLLHPGESIVLPLVFGCPAQTFTFAVDIRNQVAESNETNNRALITADNC